MFICIYIGASNSLMDAGVVYSRSALEDFIQGGQSIHSYIYAYICIHIYVYIYIYINIYI
jgi:hypothetical protein